MLSNLQTNLASHCTLCTINRSRLGARTLNSENRAAPHPVLTPPLLLDQPDCFIPTLRTLLPANASLKRPHAFQEQPIFDLALSCDTPVPNDMVIPVGLGIPLPPVPTILCAHSISDIREVMVQQNHDPRQTHHPKRRFPLKERVWIFLSACIVLAYIEALLPVLLSA